MIYRKWNKPMKIADSVTADDLNSGWFPIYKSELDTLVKMTDKLIDFYKKSKERTVFNMKEYSSDHFEINVANVKYAYGDRYNIVLLSWDDSYKISLDLCTTRYSNAENSKKLNAFKDYLEKGKATLSGYFK
jgi:hypothetical protein